RTGEVSERQLAHDGSAVEEFYAAWPGPVTVGIESTGCSGKMRDNPVTLPPGRARLVTRPLPTGSAVAAKTMGRALVACLAARAACAPPPVTMTSTLRATSSAARAGRRSGFPSASRYSIATL